MSRLGGTCLPMAAAKEAGRKPEDILVNAGLPRPGFHAWITANSVLPPARQ
jgi:hypothetical protein